MKAQLVLVALRKLLPVLIGALGTLVAMSVPTYHAAFCNGAF